MPRAAPFDDDRLRALAAAQDAVVSRRQLAEIGVTRHHVAKRTRGGNPRWQAIGDRVVLLHTGQPTPSQRWWIGVLHGGAGAALGSWTALTAAGVKGFEQATVHVVVPHGRVVPALHWGSLRVLPRQSRRYGEQPLHPVAVPPRQRVADALVVAALTAATDQQCRLVVLSTVQQRLVRPVEVREAIEAMHRLARRTLISESLDDAEGGVHSLPELAWAHAIRRAGLPDPTRQQPVQRANGTWYLDAEFAPWRTAVEIDGTQHEGPLHKAADEHRRNVLGIDGRLVLTLSSHVVRHRPDVAVVSTAAGLLSRGWAPSPQVLARLERIARRAGLDLRTADLGRSA